MTEQGPSPQRALNPTWKVHFAFLWGAPVLCLIVGKLTKLAWVTQGVPSLLTLYAGLRWELWIALLGGLVLWFLAHSPRVWVRQTALLLLYAVGGLLLCVSLADLIAFVYTRSVVDVVLLQWTWEVWLASGWRAMFPSRPGLGLWLVVLPLVVVGSPWALVTWQTRREASAPSSRPSSSGAHRFWRWGGLVLVCVLLLPPAPPLASGGTSLWQSTWLSLARQALVQWWSGPLSDDDLPASLAQTPLFSTEHTQLIHTVTLPRPNIIVVVLESTRTASTTLAQPSLSTTPFLARLARRSVVVPDLFAFTPAPLASLVPVLCGIFPSVDSGFAVQAVNSLPGRCLPTLLRPLGYKSVFFQPSSAYEDARESFVFNMGFSQFRGTEDYVTRGHASIHKQAREEGVMNKPIFSWVDAMRQQGHPFLLTVLTRMPHPKSQLPVGFPRRRFPFYRGDESLRYLNALRFQDAWLEQFVDELKRRRLLDHSILVVVGNRGTAFVGREQRASAPRLRRAHGQVPLLIHAPYLLPHGRKVQGLRQQIDLLPTLFQMMGLSTVGGEWPGSSLLKPVDKERTILTVCAKQRPCLAAWSRTGHTVFRYHRAPTVVRRKDVSSGPAKRKDVSSEGASQGVGAPSPSLATGRVVRRMLLWRRRLLNLYERHAQRRRRNARSSFQPKVEVASGGRLGSYVKVVGCSVDKKPLRPGGILDFTCVFQAQRSIPPDWRLFFHLFRGEETTFINLDHALVGGTLPLSQWEPGEYVRDRYRARIPSWFRPGETLRLVVGMWAPRRGRLPVRGGKAQGTSQPSQPPTKVQGASPPPTHLEVLHVTLPE